MTGGYRTQLYIGPFKEGQLPLEGEPHWDAEGRRLGFWSFEHSKIHWFRIPGEGENENYVPQHEWNGKQLRWKNPDGTWGDYIDLEGAGVSDIDIVKNEDFSLTITFTVSNDGVDTPYSITTDPIKGDEGEPGPAGAPPVMALAIDNDGNLIFTTQHGDLQAVSGEITELGELVITYTL